MSSEQNYRDLGGVYFPILQQDGVTRVMTKVSQGNDVSSLTFLEYLRQHDR